MFAFQTVSLQWLATECDDRNELWYFWFKGMAVVWVWFVSPKGCVPEAWSPVNDSNRNGTLKSLDHLRSCVWSWKTARCCSVFAGLSEDLNPLPNPHFRWLSTACHASSRAPGTIFRHLHTCGMYTQMYTQSYEYFLKTVLIPIDCCSHRSEKFLFAGDHSSCTDVKHFSLFGTFILPLSRLREDGKAIV